jgi:nucleoside-diphosphate-sugar epimerase
LRIFVSGGAGCLGSNLIEQWIPAGYEVATIDNFATGKREALPEVDGLTIFEGSIADKALIDRVFDSFGPTHVVHSAAAYKDPTDWVQDTSTNVVGTINIIEAARRHDVRRLINFQTALCYGRPKQVPIPIDHPLQPFTSYGISKTAGELYVLNADLPAVSLRLANICGPRLAIGPIPTFYKRLKAGQSCFCSDTVRDFLAMEDFLDVMEIVLRDDAPLGVFNVSTGEGKSIKDVFDVVAAHLSVVLDEPVPIVPASDEDVPQVVLDPSTTESALGWRAQISFEETIRRQLRWYDAYGVTDVFSHLAPIDDAQ